MVNYTPLKISSENIVRKLRYGTLKFAFDRTQILTYASYVYIVYGRVGIAPTRDCTHTGLRPHGIASTSLSLSLSLSVCSLSLSLSLSLPTLSPSLYLSLWLPLTLFLPLLFLLVSFSLSPSS